MGVNVSTGDKYTVPDSTAGTDPQTVPVSTAGTDPPSVEIEIHQFDGQKYTAHVIPDQTAGVQIGEELKLAERAGQTVLVSAIGDKIGMTENKVVTQAMIEASREGKWTLVRVGIQIRLLAGKENGNVEEYNPEPPTALIVAGSNLKTPLVNVLQHQGAEMGQYIDYDIPPKPQGKWLEARKVRLFNDILWPEHNIVCVAVVNIPHPRAYSECPEDVQQFIKEKPEDYFDKYRLAMEAVKLHCPRYDEVERFATVPFGTQKAHFKNEEDIPFVLSRLLPALREYLSRTNPVKHLDLLCFEEKWVPHLEPAADEVVQD